MTGAGTASLAADVQRSLRRARLEAERRLLERERRAALEFLGTRASELIASGAMPAGALAGELRRVERCWERLAEQGHAIDALGDPPSAAPAAAASEHAERVGTAA